ncbi:hypothetical protein ACFFRR_008434 [Megaselia abdita]
MNTAFGTLIFLLCIKQLVVGCTQSGKLSVNCYGLNHYEVPQNLIKSAEVINLARNRIKVLQVYAFQRYTNLKVLKLYDNMILHVEEGTFEPLTNLEEIDISNNGLRTLPLDLFNLPSLRILYSDSNRMFDLINDLLSLEKPISAPLEYLNVADCKLDDIPDLGILPKLKHLNASSNPLSKISLDTFSSMCALESIDLTKNQIPYCECQEIADLVAMHYTKTLSDRLSFCDKDKVSKCPDNITLIDKILVSSEYQQCNYLHSHPPISKKTWIIIGVCLAGILLLVLITP